MSAKPPILSGDLADGGAVDLLRECEARRITGELRFEGADLEAGVSGVVRLIGGEIAVDQPPRDDGMDPVDLFLDLDSASYEVHQALPPLPVAKGDDYTKSGSLAVHVPVDLMTYCEKAGLTGVLELRHEGRRAEAVYEGGELITIELDGRDATDLHEVFAWEQGRFWIRLDPEAPKRFELEEESVEDTIVDGWSPAPPRKRENTRKFLRVVEMALVDVLDESEKARSPTRTSPPLPAPPKARPRPPTIPAPPPRRRDEQTVRLVYLTGKRSPIERNESVSSTRHVQGGSDRAERIGAEAAPERRAHTEEETPMAKKRRKKKNKSAPAKRAPESKKREPDKDEAKAAPEKDEAKKAESKKEPSRDEQKKDDPAAGAATSPWSQIAGASAWAFGVLALGLLILFFLGKLPPVE